MASKSLNKKDSVTAAEVDGIPDRSHCPPDEKVRALAKGDVVGDKLLERHIEECEWCSREYKDHARDLESNAFISKSTKASYLVILAIIIFEVIRHFIKK